MIRASGGLIDRKSRLSVSFAISPSAPASSTPVGPPPTTTNVIHSARRLATCSRSAASKAMRILRRICVASSIDLRPAANSRHLSCPKYEWRAPVATISVSYAIGPPSDSATSRRSGSRPMASPSSTVVFLFRRRMLRSGWAMSPGATAPVATW